MFGNADKETSFWWTFIKTTACKIINIIIDEDDVPINEHLTFSLTLYFVAYDSILNVGNIKLRNAMISNHNS